MKDDIPEDMRPIYVPYAHLYTGEAEDGPLDGATLTHNTLTKFVERKVERKPSNPNSVPLIGLSVQQQRQMDEADKAAFKESRWAKENPHRYDFDPSRKVWVYVDYPTTPMDL